MEASSLTLTPPPPEFWATSAPASARSAAHARFNQSLVAAYERHVLLAIARRLPAFETPDRPTLLGAPVVIIGYVLSAQQVAWLWLANLGRVFHWLGDSLDGTLARVRQIERPRYALLSRSGNRHAWQPVDRTGCGVGALDPMDLVLIVLPLYQMLSIQVNVRAIVDHEFHLAIGTLGLTEMRLGIVGLNCIVMVCGQPRSTTAIGGATWPDVLVAMLSVGFARALRPADEASFGANSF